MRVGQGTDGVGTSDTICHTVPHIASILCLNLYTSN